MAISKHDANLESIIKINV